MKTLEAKRHIEANDLRLDSINIAPNAQDLAYWQSTIEFHNERKFSAWGGDPNFDLSAGKMSMSFSATAAEMRKSWINAWPEHVEIPDAVLHTFDAKHDEKVGVVFSHSLSCWKVKTGLFSKKYVIFIRNIFPDGAMPLGFAPSKQLNLAIGRAIMVLRGDEVPYRSVRMALADTEM